MKSPILVLLAALVAVLPTLDTPADDAADISGVIHKAYVQGIHIDGDPEAIRSGFHPTFVMFIRGDDGVNTVTIEDWISRIEEGAARRAAAPKPDVESKISVVEQLGDVAVAKVELHRDGKHVFTDFMSLYRFDDGWKIVAKVFHRHQ